MEQLTLPTVDDTQFDVPTRGMRRVLEQLERAGIEPGDAGWSFQVPPHPEGPVA